MTSGDGIPGDGPINLRKDRGGPRDASPAPRAERVERVGDAWRGPAWLVIPVRVVALVVLVPLRLVHDLAVQVGRGVRAVWNRLTRAPGRFARLVGRLLNAAWRGLYRWLLAPAGLLLAALARWVGAALGLLLVRPVRWLAVVVVLGFARWLGRGTAHLARWIYGTLLVPVGTVLALAGRGLAWLGERVLLLPLRTLGRGLLWLLRVTGDALGYLIIGIFTGVRVLVNALVVVPAVVLWRYVLGPALRGLAWAARGVLSGLGALGRALAAGWGAFAGAAAWAWGLLGRCLTWLARTLLVVPARAVWRYVLAPVGTGFVAAWRLAGRALRWLWRTLVVAPARVLVVAPARWAGRAVLRPVGHGIRGAWRASVRDPLRAVRRTVRETSRDVRLTFRRAFRGR